MLPRTKKVLALTAVLLLAQFLTAPVRADTIYLKGGGEVEGEILSEDAGSVKIKSRFGTMDIPRSRIASIKRGKSIRQEFEERKDALAKDDAEGHFELAGWAKEQGLRKEAKELYEEAARIDPMHQGANEALGRVLFEGRYMTPEEKELLLQDTEAREMAARGLVRYKDRWVTPEEKSALERGLVKHDGKWMTPDEKKQAEGYVKFKGRWVKGDDLERLKDLDRFQLICKTDLSAMDTEHYRLFSVYPEAETRKVADALERTYEDFVRDFGVDPKQGVFDNAKCRIFLFQKAVQFDPFMDWFGKEVGFEPQRIDLIRQNRGTYYTWPKTPYVVGYQFPDPFEQLMGRTVHKASHVLILAWLYNGQYLPWWITEGLGEFHEINVLGRCDTFCITIRGYGNDGGPSAEKWQNSDDWKAKLKSAVLALVDPDVRTFKGKDLNDLTHVDLAKSWSMVSWLIERRRERFIEFIKLMKRGVEQDEALESAFGGEWRDLDKDWREYVRANY